MLEISNETTITPEMFERLPCKVNLPEQWDNFFDHSGKIPTNFNDQRQFPRFYLRSKAISKLDGQLDCIYIKDISRNSVAFLHYDQMFPLKRPVIMLPNGTQRQAVIIRCRRIQQGCFECAAKFVDESSSEDS
ncbi:MAG: hypothetical protein COA78_03000 [Blastopirellula sp.]|nr:MAG: hypothetical protein COA78_03000 [Blastopirellula sp.]